MITIGLAGIITGNTLSLDAGSTGVEHEGMMGCCGGWGFMGFGMVFWIIILFLLVGLLVYVVERISRPGISSESELKEEIRDIKREIRELKEKKDR